MKKHGSLRNEFLGALLVIILVSNAAAYLGALFLQQRAFDQMVKTNDVAAANRIAVILAEIYTEDGSWSGLEERMPELENRPEFDDGYARRDDDEGDGILALVVTDASGRVVFNGLEDADHGKYQNPEPYASKSGEPVVAGEVTVGYVYFKNMLQKVYNPREQEFVSQLGLIMLVSVLLQVVVALVLGLLLVARLLRPLTRLDAAVQRIAAGGSRSAVAVDGHNEIASLSANFNRMLVQLDAQETNRKNLFADIAHELRTPVAILQANLEMMIDGVYAADKERLTSLHEETKLLAQLIGDLRTLSDLELGLASEVLEPVALLGLVEEAWAKYQPLFQDKGIALALVRPENDTTVLAAPHRLGQVLRNLLENALKYAGESPEVTLTVTNVAAEVNRPAQVRVEVSDQGPGVARDELEKLFERFYRAERSRNREFGGRGLGLAISRQFLAACGGQIGAINRQPHGLTVWFTVPAAHKP